MLTDAYAFARDVSFPLSFSSSSSKVRPFRQDDRKYQ